jgi:hypothetical protein
MSIKKREMLTKCTFRDEVDESGNTTYTCYIENQNHLTNLTKFDIKHLPNKDDDGVQSLVMTDCQFCVFPSQLQILFPNVTKLLIKSSKLNHIGNGDIEKFDKLKSLTVEYCYVERLNGDLFDGLEVEEISFKGNDIEVIEPEIIEDLENMSVINFLENTNISMFFSIDSKLSCSMKDLLDEIRINCAPVELKLATQQKTIEELQRQIAKMSEIQSALLSSDALKDFTINTGDSIFKVNKALLMARSPVICDLLKNNPETQELTLEDVEESTFKAVYDYMNSNELADTAYHLEVYSAAAKFKMVDLKKQAAAYLLANMDEGNCFEVLVMSNKFEHKQLQQKAFEIIRTKIFPERKLEDELMKQPEKLRTIIMAKRRFEKELEKEFESLNFVDKSH